MAVVLFAISSVCFMLGVLLAGFLVAGNLNGAFAALPLSFVLGALVFAILGREVGDGDQHRA